MGSLIQLCAYGAQDIYPTNIDDWYDKYYIDDIYIFHSGELEKYGYDDEKYEFYNDEKYIKYKKELNNLKELLDEKRSLLNHTCIHKLINEDKKMCPITYEEINDKYVECQQCKNNFDYSSFIEWHKINKSCPLCRYRMDNYIIYKNTDEPSNYDTIKKNISDLEDRIKKFDEYIGEIQQFYYDKQNKYEKKFINDLKNKFKIELAKYKNKKTALKSIKNKLMINN